MKRNKIEHKCMFCGRPVILEWDKRSHDCPCGVGYGYKPNQGRPPGRGYAEREKAKQS